MRKIFTLSLEFFFFFFNLILSATKVINFQNMITKIELASSTPFFTCFSSESEKARVKKLLIFFIQRSMVGGGSGRRGETSRNLEFCHAADITIWCGLDFETIGFYFEVPARISVSWVNLKINSSIFRP